MAEMFSRREDNVLLTATARTVSYGWDVVEMDNTFHYTTWIEPFSWPICATKCACLICITTSFWCGVQAEGAL